MPSIGDYLEDNLLSTLRGVAFSVANVYVKLHLGDAGENGTGNPAVETARKLITFNAPVAGVMTNSNTPTWAAVAATETITDVSLWDTIGPAGGNHLWSGVLTVARALIIGDGLDFPVGTVSVAID